MKVVWTFVLITFMVSLFAYLGGVTINSADTVNDSIFNRVFNVSTIGVLDSIFNGNFLSGELINFIILIITAMAITAGINAATGGNASVAVTVAYAVFAGYCISLIHAYLNIIAYVKTMAGCNTTVFQCGDIGVTIVYFFGVVLIVGMVFATLDLVGGND